VKGVYCRYCYHLIAGGRGGWRSERTTREVCDGNSPSTFHDPANGTRTVGTQHDRSTS
jgi:hypothetical protein